MTYVSPSDSDSVQCLLTEVQSIPEVFENVELVRFPVGDEWATPQTAAHIMQLIQNGGADAEITVASFDSRVKHVVETLQLGQSNLAFLHLGAFSEAMAPTRPPGPRPAAIVSRDEAVAALTTVLTDAGRALRYTDLRPLLASVDSRFRTEFAGSSINPFHQIKKLVATAEHSGTIVVSGDPDNAYVRLAVVDDTSDVERSRTRRRSRGHSVHDDKASAAEATARNLASSSDAFISTLRNANMGPFQDVRLAVYEEMEVLVQEGLRSADQLIRDSVAHVRDKRGELLRTSKPFPWAKVRTFISSLTSRVAVFTYDDDTQVALTWIMKPKPVRSLIHDWQLALDGELICFLLANGHDIGYGHVPELAGALYSSRHDDFFDRIVAVVGYLIKTDRVEATHNNELVLKNRDQD